MEQKIQDAFEKRANLIGSPVKLTVECKVKVSDFYNPKRGKAEEKVEFEKGQKYSIWVAFGKWKIKVNNCDFGEKLFFMTEENEKAFIVRNNPFTYILGGKDLTSLIDGGDIKSLVYFLKRSIFRSKNAYKTFKKYVKDNMSDGKDKDKVNAELVKLAI